MSMSVMRNSVLFITRSYAPIPSNINHKQRWYLEYITMIDKKGERNYTHENQ